MGRGAKGSTLANLKEDRIYVTRGIAYRPTAIARNATGAVMEMSCLVTTETRVEKARAEGDTIPFEYKVSCIFLDGGDPHWKVTDLYSGQVAMGAYVNDLIPRSFMVPMRRVAWGMHSGKRRTQYAKAR